MKEKRRRGREGRERKNVFPSQLQLPEEARLVAPSLRRDLEKPDGNTNQKSQHPSAGSFLGAAAPRAPFTP